MSATSTALAVRFRGAGADLWRSGVGVGLSLRASSKTARPAAGAAAGSAYTYFQQVMDRYGTAMMGGGSMMGHAAFESIMGGASAPGWMRGSSLPGAMMGDSTDPGEVMGSLFANAPGARVSAASAGGLAMKVPSGATVERSSNTILFAGRTVGFAVVSSPAGADDRFEVAGLIDPTIVIPVGTLVTIEMLNGDAASAHGLVIADAGASGSSVPMMSSQAAFTNSAIWFLGDPTSAGLHAATMTFTARAVGTYQYLCPVPTHAQKGMSGILIVRA